MKTKIVTQMKLIKVTGIAVFLAAAFARSIELCAQGNENGLKHRVVALEQLVQALQAQLDAHQGMIESLQSQLNPITQCFQFDASPPTTVRVLCNLEVQGDAKIMQNARVMGSSMLDGDTMMCKDALVMGKTMMEGDATMMQNAKVMGDATLEASTKVEGTLVLPDQAAGLSIGGELTPASSVTRLADLGTGVKALLRITPAANAGALLDIRFGVPSVDVYGCNPGGPACSPGSINNIQLKGNVSPTLFKEGDTLSLVSAGAFWREVSRSGRQISAFSIVSAPIGVIGGGVKEQFFSCTAPPDGKEGAILLSGEVELLPDGPGLVVEFARIEVIEGLGEVFHVRVRNTGPSFGHFQVTRRCLTE